MKPGTKTVAIDGVVCTRETEKALLIEPAGVENAEDRSMWLPKSQIDPKSQINIMGDVGVLVISEWIYDQKKKEKGDDVWTHFNKDGQKNG